jgi:hypothetical protein
MQSIEIVPFILRSDLKLYDWLKPATIAINNGDAPLSANEKGPNTSNVLSHEIKFVIVTTGTANPTWVLKVTEINKY